MQYGAMHSMLLELMGELYRGEKCCTDREQDQRGVIEHSAACQDLFKNPTSTVTCLPVFGWESHQCQASCWSQRNCLCFTGCHCVCSVNTRPTRLKHKVVRRHCQSRNWNAGWGEVPKESRALCQPVTSLYIAWITDMTCTCCSCMAITNVLPTPSYEILMN